MSAQGGQQPRYLLSFPAVTACPRGPDAASGQLFGSERLSSARIIATFRAFELQHRFGPFLRPIARAPEHPIAATSCFRNASEGLPE